MTRSRKDSIGGMEPSEVSRSNSSQILSARLADSSLSLVRTIKEMHVVVLPTQALIRHVPCGLSQELIQFLDAAQFNIAPLPVSSEGGYLPSISLRGKLGLRWRVCSEHPKLKYTITHELGHVYSAWHDTQVYESSQSYETRLLVLPGAANRKLGLRCTHLLNVFEGII